MSVALPIQTSCFTKQHKNQNHHLQFHPKPNLSIRSETPSSNTTNEPRKPTSPPGLGFGSEGTTVKQQSGKRDRAAIRRRTPVEKPGVVSEIQVGKQPSEEQGRIEKLFVLTWLGLGGVILVEGLALAASGFLPEEWDKFLVKYLYPIFSPTVGLFIAGSVVYGGIKYLQNEELKGGK